MAHTGRRTSPGASAAATDAAGAFADCRQPSGPDAGSTVLDNAVDALASGPQSGGATAASGKRRSMGDVSSPGRSDANVTAHNAGSMAASRRSCGPCARGKRTCRGGTDMAAARGPYRAEPGDATAVPAGNEPGNTDANGHPGGPGTHADQAGHRPGHVAVDREPRSPTSLE
jgi:hypothetical protein